MRPRISAASRRRTASGLIRMSVRSTAMRVGHCSDVHIDDVHLTDVLARYDLVDAHATPIQTTNNTVYEVTAEGFHGVLRVHRPEYRTAVHVRSELEFLVALARAGVRVPEPVRARD